MVKFEKVYQAKTRTLLRVQVPVNTDNDVLNMSLLFHGVKKYVIKFPMSLALHQEIDEDLYYANCEDEDVENVRNDEEVNCFYYEKMMLRR